MKKFTLPRDGGLIEAGLPNGIKHSYERIPAHIYEDEVAASERLAEKIVAAINSSKGVFRLGLTTGSSPIALYKSLVRRYQAGEVSFKNVEIRLISNICSLAFNMAIGRLLFIGSQGGGFIPMLGLGYCIIRSPQCSFRNS